MCGEVPVTDVSPMEAVTGPEKCLTPIFGHRGRPVGPSDGVGSLVRVIGGTQNKRRSFLVDAVDGVDRFGGGVFRVHSALVNDNRQL